MRLGNGFSPTLNGEGAAYGKATPSEMRLATRPQSTRETAHEQSPPQDGAGYPNKPGWRGTDTSRAAAEFVAPIAGKMMDRVESYLRANGPASPEEITAAIARPGENLLLTSVRARVCQLRALGRVVDAGSRGIGESGRCKVIRWRAATADELSLHLARTAAEDEKGPQHG